MINHKSKYHVGGMVASNLYPYYELSDRDINLYMKKRRSNFIGTFMRDQHPQLKMVPNSTCIINLDSSSGTGTHWVALKKNSDGTYEYYDPLGGKPLPQLLGRITYKSEIDQPPSSALCGFYSIKWCLSH
jgi:hypothetical protein